MKKRVSLGLTSFLAGIGLGYTGCANIEGIPPGSERRVIDVYENEVQDWTSVVDLTIAFPFGTHPNDVRAIPQKDSDNNQSPFQAWAVCEGSSKNMNCSVEVKDRDGLEYGGEWRVKIKPEPISAPREFVIKYHQNTNSLETLTGNQNELIDNVNRIDHEVDMLEDAISVDGGNNGSGVLDDCVLGENAYSHVFCDGNELVRVYNVMELNEDGLCAEIEKEELLRTCEYTCENGGCLSQPPSDGTTNIVINHPTPVIIPQPQPPTPAPECTDDVHCGSASLLEKFCNGDGHVVELRNQPYCASSGVCITNNSFETVLDRPEGQICSDGLYTSIDGLLALVDLEFTNAQGDSVDPLTVPHGGAVEYFARLSVPRALDNVIINSSGSSDGYSLTVNDTFYTGADDGLFVDQNSIGSLSVLDAAGPITTYSAPFRVVHDGNSPVTQEFLQSNIGFSLFDQTYSVTDNEFVNVVGDGQ